MTKTIYAINGKNITLVTPVVSPVVESIPPAVYNIQCDEKGIHLIHTLSKFDLPDHFFGDINRQHDLLIKDYQKAAVGKKSTGAILSGVKGCGKTLLMEKVSNTLISMDIPIINVEENIPAFILRKVIRSAGPCCVLFDEFEKNYSHTTPDEGRKTFQSDLLTLFSDSSLKGVMFIIASNDDTSINPMYINRPGRLKRYMKFTAPGFQHFAQIAKTKGVFDQIDQYTKVYIEDYLTSMSSSFLVQYGIDVILELVEMASETPTLHEFLRSAMYSNIPMLSRIGRRINAIVLNGKGRLTEFDYVTNGEKVKIKGAEGYDFFTIPELFNVSKSDWRGEYFEVESEGGKSLKVYLTFPTARPTDLAKLLTETECERGDMDAQKKFFRMWNGIIPSDRESSRRNDTAGREGCELSIGEEDRSVLDGQ